jgi:hypothetical protein
MCMLCSVVIHNSGGAHPSTLELLAHRDGRWTLATGIPQVNDGTLHHESEAYAQEYGSEAGMREQQAQNALERRLAGETLV